MTWELFFSGALEGWQMSMQEARNDPEFDPRRSDHKIGKDERFTKKKNGCTKPKNPLTVQ
jgi:hypothetical protein